MSDINRVIHQLTDDIVGRLWSHCQDQYEADFLQRLLLRAEVIWECKSPDPDLEGFACGHLNREYQAVCEQCGGDRPIQADAGTDPGDPDIWSDTDGAG